MPEQTANDRQIGGNHYKAGAAKCPGCGMHLEHWDIVSMFDLGYLVGTATKYLFRFRRKGGIADLEKSIHYVEKQIEEERAREPTLVPRCEATSSAGDQCRLEAGHKQEEHELEPVRWRTAPDLPRIVPLATSASDEGVRGGEERAWQAVADKT